MKSELSDAQKSALQQIPSLEQLLASDALADLLARYDRDFVLETLRRVVSNVRRQILAGNTDLPGANDYGTQAELELKARMQSVVNATGTITHTNLGRSLLSATACRNLQQVATQYVDLEYDLESGERGHRDRITEPFLQLLTGCEASTVVNNNAAAVLLVLSTLAPAKEVIISRGELIEIGGSFRIPEVMTASGAILREVGTTNRTHLDDYRNAINENTGLLLKVHPSNYAVVGFHSMPSVEQLVELGRQHQIPVFEDLGSGSLIDLSEFGLPAEPVVKERLQMGIDIVTFSGDKLLGGPQAGIIAGKDGLIQKIRQHPLMRALRVGKLTLSALEATLRLYLNRKDLTNQLPMLWRYTRPLAEVQNLAQRLAEALAPILAGLATVQVIESTAQIGSGSLPIDRLPSAAVVIQPRGLSTQKMAKHFRQSGVIGRIQDDQLWLDLRAVRKEELSLTINATKELVVCLDRNT